MSRRQSPCGGQYKYACSLLTSGPLSGFLGSCSLGKPIFFVDRCSNSCICLVRVLRPWFSRWAIRAGLIAFPLRSCRGFARALNLLCCVYVCCGDVHKPENACAALLLATCPVQPPITLTKLPLILLSLSLPRSLWLLILSSPTGLLLMLYLHRSSSGRYGIPVTTGLRRKLSNLCAMRTI